MASLYLMVLVGHTPLVVGGNSFLCPSQILNRSKTVDFGKLSLKILLVVFRLRLRNANARASKAGGAWQNAYSLSARGAFDVLAGEEEGR